MTTGIKNLSEITKDSKFPLLSKYPEFRIAFYHKHDKSAEAWKNKLDELREVEIPSEVRKKASHVATTTDLNAFRKAYEGFEDEEEYQDVRKRHNSIRRSVVEEYSNCKTINEVKEKFSNELNDEKHPATMEKHLQKMTIGVLINILEFKIFEEEVVSLKRAGKLDDEMPWFKEVIEEAKKLEIFSDTLNRISSGVIREP